MKKFIAIVLAAAITCGLFTGCGETKETRRTEPHVPQFEILYDF